MTKKLIEVPFRKRSHHESRGVVWLWCSKAVILIGETHYAGGKHDKAHEAHEAHGAHGAHGQLGLGPRDLSPSFYIFRILLTYPRFFE